MIPHRLTRASAFALASIVMSHPATAKDPASSTFLAKPNHERLSYILAVATGAGMVAVLNGRQAQSHCINVWLHEDRGKSYQSVMHMMRQYPAIEPATIILTALQNACGLFVYPRDCASKTNLPATPDHPGPHPEPRRSF